MSLTAFALPVHSIYLKDKEGLWVGTGKGRLVGIVRPGEGTAVSQYVYCRKQDVHYHRTQLTQLRVEVERLAHLVPPVAWCRPHLFSNGNLYLGPSCHEIFLSPFNLRVNTPQRITLESSEKLNLATVSSCSGRACSTQYRQTYAEQALPLQSHRANPLLGEVFPTQSGLEKYALTR